MARPDQARPAHHGWRGRRCNGAECWRRAGNRVVPGNSNCIYFTRVVKGVGGRLATCAGAPFADALVDPWTDSHFAGGHQCGRSPCCAAESLGKSRTSAPDYILYSSHGQAEAGGECHFHSSSPIPATVSKIYIHTYVHILREERAPAPGILQRRSMPCVELCSSKLPYIRPARARHGERTRTTGAVQARPS